ncbi:MAG TPA: SUMF1/EgtB/PvdO family nonheme iron enzyme [Chloroflexota bacterium]|nr:SUMF1/EgtB/PvdO family nonheme iron enzyme [Chloroflexota bacterium]
MNDIQDFSFSEDEIVPFLSFVSFRDTHRDLLKRRREEKKEHGEETPAFWTAVDEFLQRGRAAGAFLDEDSDREAAQNLLDYWETQLFHAGRDIPDMILAEFNPNLQPEIPDDRCPYVGLDAFDVNNQHQFYGRDQLIGELLNQVLVSRLITAIGPSGSGKSSVVLAGLLPRLKAGELPGSALWNYFPVIVPGSAPLTSLARLLQPEEADAATWILETTEKLRDDTDYLTTLVENTSEEASVLLIDQFEETFTLCHDEEERNAFLENLLNLVRSRDNRHVVILTMRVDYESYLTKVPLFHSLVEQGQVRVSAMTSAELHDAIEKPATAVGLKFEDGLVDAVVREIVGEPAALPLLQFALLQLWDNRERNRVTWETYRRLGGVMQVLERTANNIYDNLLPEDQVTARRILLRLVRPGEGLEFTRRRVPIHQIYQAGEAHDRVDRVLDKLIQSRLVRRTRGQTEEDDQIEVAHEALVRNWPRLVDWLDEERIRLRHRLRFTDQAEQWDALNRDEGALLRGALLQEALQYEDLSPLEADFVKASQVALQREEEEKEAARRRELEQARALAAEQGRLAREQKQLAEEQRLRAEAQAIAAQRARNFTIALVAILVLVIIGAAAIVRSVQANAAAEESARIAAENEASATQSALEAQIIAVTAQAVAVAGTAQYQEASASNATATAEAVMQQTVAAERAVEQNRGTSTAVAATATADFESAVATATQAARATPTVTSTGSNGSVAQPTSTPDAAALSLEAQLRAFVREQDNMPMLYITGGSFLMGANADANNLDEQPPHEVTVPSFYLDRFEVSIQQYADFLNRQGGNRGMCGGFDCVKTLVDTQWANLLNNFGVFEPRPGTASFPITWVSWYGADAYCRSVGRRLPTEAEWEYAAKGIDGRLYPWGNDPPVAYENAIFGNQLRNFSTAFRPVDALPPGASPFGIFGMAGGTAEWVADWYQTDYYLARPNSHLPNENNASGERSLRGGSWLDPAGELRVSNRGHLAPGLQTVENTAYAGVGFRCAQDANN